MQNNPFQTTVATMADIPNIRSIMALSIAKLQQQFLSSAEIEASKEVMGLDTQLIEDGTYFIVKSGTIPVGCGGWSFRKTLYGGNHSKGRDAARLNPQTDAAKIRAMYTHPDWTRRGIGTLILAKCERAAREAGFKRAEMMATLSGVPLYEYCGYTSIEKVFDTTSSGIKVPLVRMGKPL
ncbi:MAG TPA: GNAT family N-acetyltransferase [Hellea balneolensis]|uniref:GNAT family N-acetyltransferase n=1 Tax=Hellea balneolensis TaxID=287478 RepID=A0A7C5M244_9PROT|nr:GNAT family N-acetyltransferase [Hellea balneolensis]